jgi:hypothetical protein
MPPSGFEALTSNPSTQARQPGPVSASWKDRDASSLSSRERPLALG